MGSFSDGLFDVLDWEEQSCRAELHRALALGPGEEDRQSFCRGALQALSRLRGCRSMREVWQAVDDQASRVAKAHADLAAARMDMADDAPFLLRYFWHQGMLVEMQMAADQINSQTESRRHHG